MRISERIVNIPVAPTKKQTVFQVTYSAPGPVIEYVTPSLVVEFTAPAPSVIHVAPSEQFSPFPQGTAEVVQVIPHERFLKRIQQQTEEQVVDVPAPPIVDDTAQIQIAEGVIGIPQEPFLGEKEEQFEPILVPQSVCDAAPTPVIYVAPPPAATHAATRLSLCSLPTRHLLQ